ncbi:hypothetical protein GCM10010406_33590 [Streptomyces thermolineatus]|uniref:Transposase n=1 Tax=Streptomyces thermolineatus TaxID=44033 RepID=A0ABP5ZGF7_9ACTN
MREGAVKSGYRMVTVPLGVSRRGGRSGRAVPADRSGNGPDTHNTLMITLSSRLRIKQQFRPMISFKRGAAHTS